MKAVIPVITGILTIGIGVYLTLKAMCSRVAEAQENYRD